VTARAIRGGSGKEKEEGECGAHSQQLATGESESTPTPISEHHEEHEEIARESGRMTELRGYYARGREVDLQEEVACCVRRVCCSFGYQTDCFSAWC